MREDRKERGKYIVINCVLFLIYAICALGVLPVILTWVECNYFSFLGMVVTKEFESTAFIGHIFIGALSLTLLGISTVLAVAKNNRADGARLMRCLILLFTSVMLFLHMCLFYMNMAQLGQ